MTAHVSHLTLRFAAGRTSRRRRRCAARRPPPIFSPRCPAAQSTTSRSTTTSAPSARFPSGATPRRWSSCSWERSARWPSSTASGSPSSIASSWAAGRADRRRSTPTSRTRCRSWPATPTSTASSSRCLKDAGRSRGRPVRRHAHARGVRARRASACPLPRPHRRPVRRRRGTQQADAFGAGRRHRGGARRRSRWRSRNTEPVGCLIGRREPSAGGRRSHLRQAHRADPAERTA